MNCEHDSGNQIVPVAKETRCGQMKGIRTIGYSQSLTLYKL